MNKKLLLWGVLKGFYYRLSLGESREVKGVFLIMVVSSGLRFCISWSWFSLFLLI